MLKKLKGAGLSEIDVELYLKSDIFRWKTFIHRENIYSCHGSSGSSREFFSRVAMVAYIYMDICPIVNINVVQLSLCARYVHLHIWSLNDHRQNGKGTQFLLQVSSFRKGRE